MKIRSDFVSNSSSTSFMLVGMPITLENAISAAKARNIEVDKDNVDGYDLVWKLIADSKLQVECGLNEFYDEYVVGLKFEDMEMDETKKQFIERIEGMLKECLPNLKIKVEVCEDDGYDG